MYKWNVKALDELTKGIGKKVLHLVFGVPASGKTTLVGYYPIAQIAIQRGKLEANEKFIFVDLDGGFDFERFRQVLEAHKLDFQKIFDNNFLYFEAVDFEEQHNLITEKIPNLIKEKQIKPLLVSVDPIASIYRGIILRTDMKFRASVISKYMGKLDLQVMILRKLCVDFDCPGFITTWPSSPVGAAFRESGYEEEIVGVNAPETDFIGGRQLGYIPKCILRLDIVKNSPDSSERRVTLWKHKFLPSGGTATIKITWRGIEDVK
jgi:RecA/RadA recombinase